MGIASPLVFGADIRARLKEAVSRHSRIRTKTDQQGGLFHSKRSLVQAAIAKLSNVDLGQRNPYTARYRGFKEA